MDERSHFEHTADVGVPSGTEESIAEADEATTAREATTRESLVQKYAAMIADRRAKAHSAPYASPIAHVTPDDVQFLLDVAYKHGGGDAGAIAAIDYAIAFKNDALISALHDALVRMDWEAQKKRMH